jgi:UDP-2,3-diacylglucosamine pyrophosphatase LpxH
MSSPIVTTTPRPADAQVTPVDALKAEEERLKLLAANPPEEILTVSDFHLGQGRDATTGRFARTENFLSDQAFSRFLDYFHPGPGKLLVINGDTFDFVRIWNYPETENDFASWSDFLSQMGVAKAVAELKNSISDKEKTFGLETDDYKSAWKLLRIANGHHEFFQALSRWINEGGLLLLSKGNHDLELYWPLVRKALATILTKEGAKPEALGRLFYCDDSVRFANVYFEHGHRYDPQQRIEGGSVMETDPSQLRLPLGIFVNRYLINRLEKLEPFLGSVRPEERVLWMLLRKHPVAAVTVLFRSFRFLARAAKISNLRHSFSFIIYFAAVSVPLITVGAIIAAFVFPPFQKWITGIFGNQKTTASALGVVTPYLVAGLREVANWISRILKKRKNQIGEDVYARGAFETIKVLPFPPAKHIYAVMGHTHDQDVQILPDVNGAKVLYMNTGAWIPVWPEDRPDLDGQVLLPYIRFQKDGDEYHHEYREWRDDRGAPAESYIMNPE